MYRNARRRFGSEILEDRRCLSAISFAAHEIVNQEAAAGIATGDIDGDGNSDLIISTYQRLGWQKNIGAGDFAPIKTILTKNSLRQVETIDFDRDGDLDILAISGTDGGELIWVPNLGQGKFDAHHILLNGVDVYRYEISDIDNDGRLDILFNTFRPTAGLFVAKNIDGVHFEKPDEVPGSTNSFRFRLGDYDGDGDEDLLIGDGWRENDGDGEFANRHSIPLADQVRIRGQGDFDGDGDLDLFSSEGLWTNSDTGQFEFTIQLLPSEGLDVYDSIATDADGDGDLDLYLMWGFNESGSVSFLKNDSHGIFTHQYWLGASHSIIDWSVDDVSGNGEPEVFVLTYGNKLVRYEGRTENVMREPYFSINDTKVVDMDEDGDLDLLVASTWGDCRDTDFSCRVKVTWQENIDGDGNAWNEHLIVDPDLRQLRATPVSISAGDLDGDADLDILIGAYGNTTWWKNEGDFEFIRERSFAGAFSESQKVSISDLDRDGDQDVIIGNSSNVNWFENVDVRGQFSEPRLVTATSDNRFRLVDIDGDDDDDIVVDNSDGLNWFENDGAGEFVKRDFGVTISAVRFGVRSFTIGDLDNDGDLDLVTATKIDERIQVTSYENVNDSGTFETPALLSNVPATGLSNLLMTDIDQDGDVDLTLVTYSDNSRAIQWFENSDGSFATPIPIAPVRRVAFKFGVLDVDFVDIDSDGDMDFVSDGFWYENRVPGDVNNDGRFNSSDLVLVFRAGEFNDPIAGNSTFETGDWNGDGDFDTEDFIFVFQAGVYQQNASPAPFRAATIDGVFLDFAARKSKRGLLIVESPLHPLV